MHITSQIWAPRFRTAISLLGQASADLPIGSSEPILVGAAAMALYSGGLWRSNDIELIMDTPRPLHETLFAKGFRWVERPRHVARGLWHPTLDVAVEILPSTDVDYREMLVAELAVPSEPDAGCESTTTRLRIVGIEDLIAGCAADWNRRASRGPLASQLQTLIELAHAGIGGGLQIAYLKRRLAEVSAGEIDLNLPDGQLTDRPVIRRMLTEASLEERFQRWSARQGSGRLVPRQRGQRVPIVSGRGDDAGMANRRLGKRGSGLSVTCTTPTSPQPPS